MIPREDSPEAGILVVAGLATVVVAGLLYRVFRKDRFPPEETTDAVELTQRYLANGLLASAVLTPLAGIIAGNAAALGMLPLAQFFFSILIFPGAAAINYAGMRWRGRALTRALTWVAGLQTVVLTWSAVLAISHFRLRPPAVIIDLVGLPWSCLSLAASIPLGASTLSLAFAWFLEGRLPARK